MELHESAEDYLEAILMLSEKNGHVRAIDVAKELEFSKPSVSIAMKKLTESGHVTTDENGFLVLTAKGKSIAKKTYGRHKLLVSVLEALGVKPETAEKEACKIEHDISDKTVSLLEKYYNEKMNK